MINVDALGLSPTKVWTAHSDKDLVHSLIVMVYALKLSASQIDIAAAGATDSDPFAAHHIPQITIHSLTQQNVATGATTQFRPGNYYDTYRLLCGYLAYLDQSLKPRALRMNAWARFFKFDQHGTTFSREVIAGLTTFTTMSYIVVVNPAILSNAGIPAGPSFVATVVAAVFGCTLMGLYANRPFAIAPYMGENAFIAFTVCGQLGYKWQTALAAIFIAGVLFVLLTVFRLRQWVVEAVPLSLRYSFAVGIGLFLTFIGLNQTGIVTLGVAGAPVRAGHLTSAPVLVAISGFLLLAILVIRRVRGAILLGIIATAVIAFAARIVAPPAHFISLPPSLKPILWQLDFRGAFYMERFSRGAYHLHHGVCGHHGNFDRAFRARRLSG